VRSSSEAKDRVHT